VVRAVTESGRPLGQVARELELRAEQQGRWKKLLQASGQVAPAASTRSSEEENRRLKRENETLRRE
jgi:transposase-like protein